MTKCLLALAATLLVACSRTEPPIVDAPPAAPRGNLDSVLVQKSGSDAEAADSAVRETLKAELDALVEKLSKAETLPAAFRIVESIEDLGKTIAKDLQASVPKLPPVPRIAGYRAVWTLGSLENEGWDIGVKGLLAMVTGEGETAHRAAAAEVLGTVASQRHVEILKKALNEQVFEPEVRVPLAVALWRSNRDTAATKVLDDMVASENESFQIMAALALGEINRLTSESAPILERLADEPTLRGRIAKRALDYFEAVKRFDKLLEHGPPGEKKPEKIDTKYLGNLERMIKERYIYPDAVAGRGLMYAAASGMLASLDPYTCLLEDNELRDAAEIRRFAVPTLGLMLGSARIQPNRELRLTRVLSVKPGSPAEQADIRPGDRIYRVLRGVTEKDIHELRIGAKELPDENNPFQYLPLDEAVTQFQGAVGTTLGLNIFRDGWLLSRWVHVTHTQPDGETVSSEVLPGNIGMVHVVELNAGSPAQVKEALAALKKKEVKALILDLRNCAGGSVEAATQVAGMFLPKETVVTYSFGRSAELAPRTEYKTGAEGGDTGTPLVLLVNGGTADAGEVLAGALHEHKRARVAGKKTFGRAIVQELIPLDVRELEDDGRTAALLLTVARYYGPVSGVEWYDRGVEPDMELTPKLFEGWVYDQFDEATENPAFGAYLDACQKDLEAGDLLKLARSDGRNPAAWPEFEKLHTTLALQLSREDLRFLVRREMRERLLAQGAEINQVDLQEDNMFTGAVKEAAKAANIDLSEIPEYTTLSK